MKYRELLVEYKGLLDRDIALRMELHAIPKGYLVTKKISGKEYLYLQYSAQGKKKSEYIRDEEAVSVRAAIARREPVKAEMDEIHLALWRTVWKVLPGDLDVKRICLQCERLVFNLWVGKIPGGEHGSPLQYS